MIGDNRDSQNTARENKSCDLVSCANSIIQIVWFEP